MLKDQGVIGDSGGNKTGDIFKDYICQKNSWQARKLLKNGTASFSTTSSD